jgi:hypothetical protein
VIQIPVGDAVGHDLDSLSAILLEDGAHLVHALQHFSTLSGHGELRSRLDLFLFF